MTTQKLGDKITGYSARRQKFKPGVCNYRRKTKRSNRSKND